MTKFKITHDNQTIEFNSLEEAQTYVNTHSLVVDINEYQDVPVVLSTSPQAVTPRQMRIALVMSGISLSTIEAIINSLPEPDQSITRITWEYSIEFQRSNPLLVGLAPALGLSPSQVDDLFALAGTI